MCSNNEEETRYENVRDRNDIQNDAAVVHDAARNRVIIFVASCSANSSLCGFDDSHPWARSHEALVVAVRSSMNVRNVTASIFSLRKTWLSRIFDSELKTVWDQRALCMKNVDQIIRGNRQILGTFRRCNFHWFHSKKSASGWHCQAFAKSPQQNGSFDEKRDSWGDFLLSVYKKSTQIPIFPTSSKKKQKLFWLLIIFIDQTRQFPYKFIFPAAPLEKSMRNIIASWISIKKWQFQVRPADRNIVKNYHRLWLSFVTDYCRKERFLFSWPWKRGTNQCVANFCRNKQRNNSVQRRQQETQLCIWLRGDETSTWFGSSSTTVPPWTCKM